MKKLRYLVSAGVLSSIALTFAGCHAVAPLFGTPDVDAQGRRLGGGEKSKVSQPQMKNIDYKKELVITDLSVVEDPYRTTGYGPWTFAYLMTQMAGGRDPEMFIRDWLNNWMEDQTVNGDTVVARKKIKELILDPWPRIPGTDRLDLSKAPFRLLAITNRMDLRKVGDIGEGRFVFGVLDRGPNPAFGEAVPFTVIFEYGVTLKMGNPDFDDDDYEPGNDGADERMKAVRMWANKWHALSGMAYGPQYNAALQQITDSFAKAGANPKKPNGSALNQLRTNEIQLSLAEAFGPTGPTIPINQIKPWEMREFHVEKTGYLEPVVMGLTPKFLGINNTAQLAAYINKNEKDILRDRHKLPANWLAGSSLVPGAFNNDSTNNDPPLIWNAPGIRNSEARFKFSQNTCSGCHLAESGFEKQNGGFIAGKAFMHVRPRLAGQEAGLSPFMTGVNTVDAVTGKPRTLNDLERRIDDAKVLMGYTKTSRFYNPERDMENPFPAKVH